MSKHYVGEVGTLVLLDTGIDLSDIVSSAILYKKADGAVGTWPGILYSSYSDLAKLDSTYYVSYTLAGTDLNNSGDWEVQALIANTAGTWYGETAQMTVYATFE